MNFDDIVLDPKLRASVNYAKARGAIEQVAKNRATKRVMKQAVIDHLKGRIETKTISSLLQTKIVRFDDGTTAKY